MNRYISELGYEHVNMMIKPSFPYIGGRPIHVIGYYDEIFGKPWRRDRRSFMGSMYAAHKAVDRIPELSRTRLLERIICGDYDVKVADDNCVVVGQVPGSRFRTFYAVNYGDLRYPDGRVPDFCHFVRATDSDEYFDVAHIKQLVKNGVFE